MDLVTLPQEEREGERFNRTHHGIGGKPPIGRAPSPT